VCLIAAWSLGTLAGHAASAALISPEALALDFAFTAVFSAIAAGLWRGRGDLLPWLVSAGAALAASSLIGGKWYIVIGGVAGAVAGACGPGERAAP
jgi:predicted branched-subunit amino acid permease